MAYHEITLMDVWEVLRRWHSGSGIRSIARSLQYDRKTVQRYIRLALSIGISREKDLPPKDEALNQLRAAECTRGRSAQAQNLLEPYIDQIRTLVNDPDHSLKPKNAYRFLAEEYDLGEKVSYTTFKRFVRRHKLSAAQLRSTCRIEVPPGRELQIDYAHVGKRFDPVEGRMRKLYAFIGTLSHSRLKYVELTFRQDQKSFVASHVRMFDFLGGVPSLIIIDNLKSGIISPDLYDPTLNRAYGEMAEYYGTFIDPARVRTPQDKGKVERDVQTVREAVHLKIHLHPGALVGELNRLMLDWASKEYGIREHGTTREKPFEAFTTRERPALKALPQDAFEMVEWKEATVHPDHYVQFRKKTYSVPHPYVGKRVWIRATERMVQIYAEERLVATHVIGKGYRHTDYSHFPENVRAVLDTSTLHRSLLDRSGFVGPEFSSLIRGLLEGHAYMHLRCAQGLVAVADKTPDKAIVELAARQMRLVEAKPLPKILRHNIERITAERAAQQIPLSDASREYLRDISYFIKSNEGHS